MSQSTQTGKQPFLEVRNVWKTFGNFVALHDVSVQVEAGEFIAILGPSGCGKTTLLRIIAGLEQQNSGHVFIQGSDVSNLPTLNRRCGIVFQSYALFPNLSVRSNIAYGMHKPRTEANTRVDELLSMVHLDGNGRKYPSQLSGGEQQRVALARALATDPSLLLLDEPLSALDARVRLRLRSEIRNLQKRIGVTTILVTHDQEEALTMADRVIVMEAGCLKQCAAPEMLYHAPDDLFVAGFVGTMNFLHGFRAVDHNHAACSPFIIRFTKESGAVAAGDEITLAVRPEHVQLDLNHRHDHNVFPAKVVYVEFRGSFYRVGLELHVENGDASNIRIDADVQTTLMERLRIGRDTNVSIHLPASRVLAFKRSESPNL